MYGNPSKLDRTRGRLGPVFKTVLFDHYEKYMGLHNFITIQRRAKNPPTREKGLNWVAALPYPPYGFNKSTTLGGLDTRYPYS
jgi:hypothetical protein